MARDFRTAQFVNHGSGASLDNLAQVSGGFSWWVWLFRGVDAANQHFLTKDQTIPDGWLVQIANSPSNGCLRFIVFRNVGVNIADAVSTTVVSPLYTPAFVTGAFDTAASPAIKLFYGSQSAAVAEVTYTTQDSGSGTPDDDAGASLYVGNLQRLTTGFFQGSIQMGGIISGDFLTATEFESIRLATRNAPLDNPTLSRVAALFPHVLLFNYQGGDVTDRSGTGNNGTVTGAQSSPDFPIVPAMGFGSQSTLIIDRPGAVGYR